MDLTLGIAIIIVLILGFWTGRHPHKAKQTKKSSSQGAKVYPLSRARNQTKLRRVK